VTSTKIHSGAITPGKLASKSFGGRIFAVTEIATNGAVMASDPKGVKVTEWTAGSGGIVTYPHRFPKGCWPVAAPAEPDNPISGRPPNIGAGSAGLNAVQIAEDGPVQLTLMIVCLRG
jgi:hypothetical protein